MKTKPNFKIGDLVKTEYGLAVITKSEWIPAAKSNHFEIDTDKPIGLWYYHFTVAVGNNIDVGGFSPLYRTGAKHGDNEDLIILYVAKPKPRFVKGQIVLYKGIKCQIASINDRTGSCSLTVEFRIDCKPYKVGDKIVVMPNDLKPYKVGDKIVVMAYS